MENTRAFGQTDDGTRRRLTSLDGLRGLAILGVMMHHFGVHPGGWLDWGPVAPTVFFILSGYLVTQSLQRLFLNGSPGFGRLAGFHLKRVSRLLPALYLMLFVGYLSGLPEFREGLLWHAGFLSNVYMAMTGEWAESASQLWSLGVQEQFYLLWPFVFFAPRRWWVPLMVGIFLSATLFRWTCVVTNTSDMVRWLLLPASVDAFAAGGLLALFLSHQPNFAPRRWGWMSFPLIFACWVVARALRHLGSDNPWIAIIDPFEIAVFGWLLLLIVRVPGGWISRVFGWQPLVFLGKISYGLFIWHMLVVCALNPHLTAVGLGDAVLIKATFFTVASVGIAWLSWIAIERPALAWASAWKLPASGVLPGLRALWARLSALVEGVRNFGRESV